MKQIIYFSATVLLALFYLPACKKSDKPQTTIEKVQAKWQLVTQVDNNHVSGQDNISTITGTTGDIIDFRTDGKVYSNTQGQADTTTYALSGDTKIIIDGNLDYDITVLTTNSFILHSKLLAGGSDFYEETITLKK